MLAHQSAVSVGYPILPVDVNPQKHAPPAALELHIHQRHALGRNHSLRHRRDLLEVNLQHSSALGSPPRSANPSAIIPRGSQLTKKWAFAHLCVRQHQYRPWRNKMQGGCCPYSACSAAFRPARADLKASAWSSCIFLRRRPGRGRRSTWCAKRLGVR